MSDVPATRASTPIPPAGVPGLDGLMTLAVGVVVVAGLYIGREVLIPITLAVLLSFVLAPLVRLLRRAHLGRTPSVLLAVIAALGIILGLGAIIGGQVAQLASDIPRYAATIEQKVDTVRTQTLGRMATLTGQFGNRLRQAGNNAAEATGAEPEAAQEGPKPLAVEVRQPAASPIETAQSILEPILHPLATMGIVLIVTVFILLQQEDLRDRLIRLLGSGDLHRTTAAMDDAARRLSRYFLTQLALNAAFGLFIALALAAIGVPNWALWGIISGLFRFVPYVGAILSSALPIAMAAAVDPGWSMVIWTATVFLFTETVMGQVVEPLVYGHSTGLSPVSVVIAAIFWTWLWGPIGLILAMPLTLCLVVLGRHIDRLEFIDVLLGDRPALTPIESFYQRILAGDADEVLAQAEIMLKTRSLSSYYDEVAIKALELAANDVARGVVSEPQLDRIRVAVDHVVTDLADHDDIDPVPDNPDGTAAAPAKNERELPESPPPDSIEGALPASWQGAAPVLCVAARGALDEAASEMLMQILGKHGLGARVVPEQQVARGEIAALDVTGVQMVCVSYLDPAGNPSTLRYLIRRLRRRLPAARIVVAIWQAEEAFLKDERMRALVRADDYTTTLRDTVNVCIEAARTADGVAVPVAA